MILLRALCLLSWLTPSPAFAGRVTISADWSNGCVQRCLIGWVDDMGEAMQCGNPYQEECFCATASASASRATSFASRCISSKCAEGDDSLDLSALQSAYASYCMGAGYTQPGMTAWYVSAKPTDDTSTASVEYSGLSPTTTTRVAVVTQTAESSAGRSGDSATQVIVRITSTVWAGSSQTDSATHTNDKSKQVGLGVGLGIGIPLVLVICAIPMWKYLRRRSRRTGLGAHMDGSSEDQGSNIYIPPPKAVMGIQRNSLDASIAGQSSKTMQKELDGVSLRYPEIDGRQQFELMGDSEPCEVEGRGSTHCS